MELKLLQKDVAKILDVTGDSIINWEMNRSSPQIQFFPKIIEFLGYLPFKVDTSTLGGRLSACRQIHGHSIKSLGKLLKVNERTISAWESGENRPKERMLVKLGEIFRETKMVKFE